MTRFRSKVDGFNQRLHCWACLRCRNMFHVKQILCPECQAPVQYFPSRGELRRYRELQLELRHGSITDLEVQPAYPVVINGVKVTTYRADFKYQRGGESVVEDSKGSANPKNMDPVFVLKKKLIEAVYGFKITITTTT